MSGRVDNLLETLESEFQHGRIAGLDRNRTLHRTATGQAVTMMASEQLAAFDLKQESATTVEAFGDHPFGRSCLAAVRLIATGVRCIEVELTGWDSHINNHELQCGKAAILDRALAATMRELVSRDLLDDTIVFCGGEFGRTPNINPASGRDHWPHGFSTLLAGGSLRRGYVHGATAADPDPEKLKSDSNQPFDVNAITENPVSVPDLHATLLHALGVDHEEEMLTPVGRPLKWSDGSIVKELLQN